MREEAARTAASSLFAQHSQGLDFRQAHDIFLSSHPQTVLRIILTYAIMHSTAASRRHSPSKDNGGRPESCGTGRNQAPSVKRGNLHPHAVGGLSERRMRAMRIRRSFLSCLLRGGVRGTFTRNCARFCVTSTKPSEPIDARSEGASFKGRRRPGRTLTH